MNSLNSDFSAVEQVLQKLRPAMQADGGNVELVSVENGVVFVKLLGTCLFCPSAGLTLKLGIEKTLKEQIAWVTEVVRI